MNKRILAILVLLTTHPLLSAELSVKGLIDIRGYHVNNTANNNSYITGDYGKFRFSAGNGIALGQLGLQAHLDWGNNWSATLVGNAFADRGDNAAGFTEAFLSYKNLPNQQGYRIKAKAGVFYPKVSMENVATAWSTPYTLATSTLNNWIGEELRSTGVSIEFEKLGKFSNSPHSFSAEISAFQQNDTTGAMLTWHGWTLGSRQTLLHEKLKLPYFPARDGKLIDQAEASDPIKELDNRWGLHVIGSWRYKRQFKLTMGYYDNHAQEGVVENGQYTWITEFFHLGVKYRINKQWELISQYMNGSTYMTDPQAVNVADIDYDNGFIMLRNIWKKHHIAVRVEHFSTDDVDNTVGDNNNESGKAITLAHRYQLDRQQFLLVEMNWLDAKREARIYVNQPISLIERQVQIGYRYYF